MTESLVLSMYDGERTSPSESAGVFVFNTIFLFFYFILLLIIEDKNYSLIFFHLI